MAKGRGLSYKAELDTTEALRKAKELKKAMSEMSVSPSGKLTAPSTAGISQYREAQLKMQEALKNARLETEKLKTEQARLRAELEAGKVAQQNAKTATEQHKIAEQALRVALQQGKITQQDYNTQVTAGKIALQAKSVELKQASLNDKQAATALKAHTLEQKRITEAAKLARLAHKATSGSYKEAQQRLTALGNEIRNTTGAFGNQSPALKAKVREYNELNDKLKQFDSTMGNHQRNVGNYGGALAGAGAKLAGLAAGFLSAQVLLTSAFDTALRTDAIKTSLEFTFNSTEVAAEKMDNLRATAKRLGLEYISLADTYRAFAGAAVASNFSIKETDRIFNAVANAGAKLKLSSDQVSGALTALQQMISKGKVSSEELTQQLGERLPGALSIASRAMGLTNQEMFKLMESGQLMASDLLPKLATELDKTFKNDTAEKVNSLQGSVNRLKNAFTEVVETKGAVGAFFEFVVDKAASAVGAIATLSKALGIFYDLARNPKGFINDSVKDPRAQANTVITNNARGSAKEAATGLSKAELVKRVNEQVELLRKLAGEYKKTEQAYNSTNASDRSLTDTKRFQALGDSLRYQQEFVTGLKNEFGSLYPAIKKAAKELSSVASIRAEITRLSKIDGSATIGSDTYNQIEALKAKLKKPKDTTASEYKTAEREATALGEHMTKLLASSSMASLDADEKEVESVKAKYAEIRKEATKFYGNPKNAGLKVKVNGQNFSKSQIDGSINAMESNDLKAIAAKDAAEAAEEEKKRLDGLLKEFMNYNQKREELTKQYNADMDSLVGNPQQQIVRAEVYNSELEALDDANVKKLTAYQHLFNGIDKLSDENAKVVIANAQRMLTDLVSTGGISKELAQEIADMIGQSTVAIISKLPDQIINVARQLDEVANSVGGINEAFGEVLHNVANVVGQVGNIKKGILDFNKEGATGLEKLGSGLGMVSAAVSIATTAIGFATSLFGGKDKKLEKAITRHQEEVTKLGGLYNQLERDINNSVGKSVKKAQEDQMANLKAQQAELIKMRKAEEDKKKTDQGKVDDYTEQIASLGQQAIDLQNTIHEALTGTTARNITDAIIQGFRDGKRSVADFAESFRDLMSGALFSALQTDLEPQVAAFYKRFISASSDGLTDTEYRDLQAEYDAIIKDGLDKVSAIDKITGNGASGSTGSSLQGDIKSITTEQAGVLTGTMNGIRLATLDSNRLLTEGNKVRFDAYSIAKGNFDLTVKIEQNTLRTANNTDKLEGILASIDRKIGSNAQALAANGR